MSGGWWVVGGWPRGQSDRSDPSDPLDRPDARRVTWPIRLGALKEEWKMLRRVACFCCLWFTLLSVAGWAAEADVVTEYEARLEAIAAEIQQIRQELEALVQDLAEPEVGRVFVFLATAPAAVRAQGVTVVVDEHTVFARPFTPAEQGVLGRGLPLELVDLRLLEGDHSVALFALNGEPTEPARFAVRRGVQAAWIAQLSASGVTWQRD